MPDFLAGLDPEFKAKVQQTIRACDARGVDMVPYFGIRTPFQQGKLWRQSRSTGQIAAKISSLQSNGASFLAHSIESVGPQHGPPVTNAIPGYSWHQWGEAVDCYWLRNGNAEWSTSVLGNRNGYRIYAHEGTETGLSAGGYWQSFKDWPHLQKRRAGSPNRAGYSLAQINAKMEELFG